MRPIVGGTSRFEEVNFQLREQKCVHCRIVWSFQKLAPDATVAMHCPAGSKKMKGYITVLKCSNADGSEKIPLMVI